MSGGLEAGDFGGWLRGITAALDGNAESAVPCGDCIACCTSSQFIHIDPSETAALARIPEELLVPAPGLPPGVVVLGYDEHGRCPMLVGGHCSIYQDRPRACRVYDCRVFAATGVELDEVAKREISERVAMWHFTIASVEDEADLTRLRAAATALSRDEATSGLTATKRALMALATARR